MGALLQGIPRTERRKVHWWSRAREVQAGWWVPPLSAIELAEWAAFERLHGPLLVQERTDVAAAIVGSVTASTLTGRRVSPAELLPRWSPQTPEEQMDVVRAAFVMAGGAPSPPSRR